jgi:hypothetical protein
MKIDSPAPSPGFYAAVVADERRRAPGCETSMQNSQTFRRDTYRNPIRIKGDTVIRYVRSQIFIATDAAAFFVSQ